MAEAGEADGDGGSFARGAVDGNRAAMFFDDLFAEARPRPMPVRCLVKTGLKTLSTNSAGIGAPGYRKVGL